MNGITMSVSNAAKALDVSQPTVWRLIKKGKLTKVSIGRRSLVTTDSLRQLVEAA
jgi:excisionase family DNA binding protein